MDTECRQVCFVSCAENERIVSAHAITLRRAFIGDADKRKANFRPQRQSIPVRVVPNREPTNARQLVLARRRAVPKHNVKLAVFRP
jgi:hypothetical protein